MLQNPKITIQKASFIPKELCFLGQKRERKSKAKRQGSRCIGHYLTVGGESGSEWCFCPKKEGWRKDMNPINIIGNRSKQSRITGGFEFTPLSSDIPKHRLKSGTVSAGLPLSVATSYSGAGFSLVIPSLKEKRLHPLLLQRI